MAKCWCFTLNNWSEEEYQAIWNIQCSYLIIGKEVGQQGTPHLQGYIKLNKYCKKKEAIVLLGERTSVRCARGSALENKKYCSKGEGTKENPINPDFAEKGVLTEQGKRTDIELLYEAIDAGTPEWTLWKEMPNAMNNCLRSYDRIKACKQREEAIEAAEREILPEVHVLWGDTGVGKTTAILREYGPRNCYAAEWGDSTHIWWDGYEDQENIVINDFYGNLPLCYMLRLLGDHMMRLNAKNTFKYRRAKRIFITSNIPPDQWYNPATVPEKKLAALRRRLTSIEELGMHARPQCFQ